MIGLPTVGANSTLFNTDPRDLDLKASEKDLTGGRAAGNDVGEIDEDEEGEERQMVEIPMGVLKPVEYPAMTIFVSYEYSGLSYLDSNFSFNSLFHTNLLIFCMIESISRNKNLLSTTKIF